MTNNTKFSNKLISVLVCIALIFSIIPLSVFNASAATTGTTIVSDPSTIDQWKQYFPTSGNITTQNAGGVWTDKSVFTEATTIDGEEFTINGQNNFLVALSAIGSNMSITGQASASTDTVLVLDMSSSMSGNVGSLATATNTAIKALYEANPQNRVSIVTYSADNDNATKIFLPLDTYTATSNFLTSRDNTLSIASGVKNSKGATVSGSVSLNRGTYIQGGLAKALDVLNSRTVVTDRIPVVVLMTDGEPTIGSTDIVNPNGNLGFGVNNVYGGDAYNFATQLSLAYMKQEAYKNMLLYTIGVGVDDSDSVLDILNPTEPLRTRNLRTYWTTYKDAAVGSNVSIGGRSFSKPAELDYNYVSQIDDGTAKVNGYFSASSSNLSTELTKAFESVVAEIVKSSVYSPTLVQSVGHELSGYVSFVDKIGSYMKVSELKGIMYGGQLFTGQKIAEAFYNANQENPNSELGNISDPSSLGYAFMRSIESRLGIDNAKAWAVMRNAWQKGQISYNASSGAYSNWFGWVSTSAGGYIEPWYEGMTLPANAGYINRSFIYLGASEDTNMMYSTVRIREKVVNGVATGEQEVAFAVPASLVPTITYEVTLDENNTLDNINVIEDTPIHLIYEAGLDPEINKFNLKDKVSPDYIANNSDSLGNVLFYTNEWERTPDSDGKLTGYNKSNTYAYFRPSQRNDRYYYQNDSLIYTNTNGTVYTSSTTSPKDVDGTYYYYYTYYAREGLSYKTVGEYHVIPKDVLSVAAKTDDNRWLIKKGTVRSDYSGSEAHAILKDDPSTAAAGDGNKTGTLSISHEPFADTNSYAWDDTTHSSVVGVTLANNGVLGLASETGIRLSKALASDVVLESGENPTFTFTIEYAGQNSDLEAYAYRFVNGELTGAMETVAFSGGEATVELKAGETLYIGGMASGEVTITEQTTLKYTVGTVSINNTVQNTDVALVTLTSSDMVDVDFINTLRETGAFTVAKNITHDFGAGYTIPENEFTTFKVELSFSFNGAALSGQYSVSHTDGSESQITLTGTANEKVEISLGHNDQYTVYGLPVGTVVKAEEKLTNAQQNAFTPSYYQNINQVTVSENEIASVIILNDYNAQSVSPTVTVEGTKTLTGNLYSDEFTFTLQKYKGSGAYTADTSWDILDTKKVSYSNAIGDRDFTFTYDWAQQEFNKIGTYIYRVHESRPSLEGMIYDTRIHTFQIDVTDSDMDGKLEAAVTTTRSPQVSVTSQGSNSWNVHTAFQNEYTSNHTVSTAIYVQKAITNLSESAIGNNLAGFTFGLYDSEKVLIEKLTTNSIGAVRFSKTYTASQAGTYTYYLKEIAPDPVPKGWSYDNTEVKLTVTVSQISNSLHYQAVITTDSANAVINSEGNEAVITFTNTYAPDNAELDIDFVSKKLTSNAGTRQLSNGEFEFAIYELDERGNRKATPITTGKNNAQGKVSFASSLSYNKVGGPYFYDIVELKPNDAPDYISYDSTVYEMTVNVTDNNGKLEAKAIVENVANNDVVFNNIYTAKPAKVVVEGNKTLTGRSLIKNDFQFVMTNTETDEAIYTTNSTSGTQSSDFAFPEITYTKTGVYNYTVKEYNPKAEIADFYDGVTYDNTVYTVKVTVTDNGEGELEASYTVNGGNTPIAFSNTYKPNPINVTLEGFKALIGRNILASDQFTFELFDAEIEPDTLAWSKGGKLDEQNCLVDGSIAFNLEPINKAGRYPYIITEKIGNAGGIDYDLSVWRALVVVNDDGQGALTSRVYYMNEEALQDRMVFINTYTASDKSIIINGEKTLEGRRLTDQEFTFELYEAEDEGFGIKGDAVKTVKNNADGSFEFKLDYTKEDIGKTFYYVAKEENAGLTLNDVTYSNNEYRITVNVEDNLDGSLKITKEITLEENNADTLRFVNKYSATASVKIDITKTVKNKGSESITPEGFKFVLINDATGKKQTVKSDKNGDAEFVLGFTEKDAGKIFKYTIKEIDTGVSNVKYSDAEYSVEIELSLDDSNKLIATVKQNNKQTDKVNAEFVNEYDYTLPKDTPRSPQTGDSSNLSLWFALLFVSGGGIIGTASLGKKKKEDA